MPRVIRVSNVTISLLDRQKTGSIRTNPVYYTFHANVTDFRSSLLNQYRQLTRFFILMVGLFIVHSLATAAPPQITGMAFLADEMGEKALEQIQQDDQAGAFTRLNGNAVNLGFSSTDHWFRVDVRGGDTTEWMTLELSNPRLGEVTIFAPNREGGYLASSAGVRTPFWSRHTPGLAPAFALRIENNTAHTFYFRVRNYGSLRFEMRLWELREHIRHANYVLAGALLVAGALLLLSLYNFCIYLNLRQRSYLWIALFLITCTVWQMSATSTANMFLWPNAPFWGRHAVAVTGTLTMVVGAIMANNLLTASLIAPKLGRAIVVIGLLPATGFLWAVKNQTVSLYILLACAIALPLLVTWLAITAIRSGSAAGRSFLISWGIVLLAFLVTNLTGPGLLPANVLTLHFMDIALLGAGLSWSFALTGRLKVQEHQQRLLLEAEVNERTAELVSALDAVKTLHGLLPICSCCKKIRDDQGYWQHVESYLQAHTDADFSHGICPECAHTFYPEYFPERAPKPHREGHIE